MATRYDNYLKVRLGNHARVFFYHSDDPPSFDLAQRAANRCTVVFEKQGGAPVLSVWKHDRRLLHVECVGGCETCAPAPARVVGG